MSFLQKGDLLKIMWRHPPSHQDATAHARAADKLPGQGDCVGVSILHSSQAAGGPPPADGDTGETGHVVIFLRRVDKHRKDGNGHKQKEKQRPNLMVAVS